MSVKKVKISVYTNEQGKERLLQYAAGANLTLSEYLLQQGLQIPIISSKVKSHIASDVCKLILSADSIEDLTIRGQIKKLAGDICVHLEG